VHTGFWWGDLREGDHLGDLGVDGRIILKWIFNKWDWEAWIGLIRLRIEQVAGSCECSNESLGFIKWGIILKWIFNKWDWEAWIGLTRLRIGQVASSCECSNEFLGFVK